MWHGGIPNGWGNVSTRSYVHFHCITIKLLLTNNLYFDFPAKLYVAHVNLVIPSLWLIWFLSTQSLASWDATMSTRLQNSRTVNFGMQNLSLLCRVSLGSQFLISTNSSLVSLLEQPGRNNLSNHRSCKGYTQELFHSLQHFILQHTVLRWSYHELSQYSFNNNSLFWIQRERFRD